MLSTTLCIACGLVEVFNAAPWRGHSELKLRLHAASLGWDPRLFFPSGHVLDACYRSVASMADADAAPDGTMAGDAAATAATANAGNSGFDAGYVDDLGDSQFQGYFANVELDANPPSQRMGMRTGSFDRLASMIDHVKSGDNEFVHRSVRGCMGGDAADLVWHVSNP